MVRRHVLCLARASSGTVSLRPSGGGTVSVAVALAVSSDRSLDVQRVGKRSLGHASQRLARGAFTALLVGGEVEGDEEDQIRAEDGNTRERGKFLTSALAGIWQPWKVGRREVGV